MIEESPLIDRFCRYARLDTASDRHSRTVPTTESQRNFALGLAEELRGLGAPRVEVDDHAFVLAGFEAAGAQRDAPTVGFIAHMDTSAEAPSRGIRPIVHRGFDGSPIPLAEGLVLDPAEFPELAARAGETIVTSDGTTLLGADDKAGITIIMACLEHLAAHPELPRCALEIIFTPDEETGLAMPLFPLSKIRSAACYTVDGAEEGSVETECFDAYKVNVVFRGKSMHLGKAKGKLVNAVELAGSFLSLIPRNESPQATDGRDGYYCPFEIRGSAEKAELDVLVRDFQDAECLRRVDVLQAIASAVEAAFPGARVSLETQKQYANMKRRIDERHEVVDSLKRAISLAGVAVKESPIRGGTDGARLTELGIPTPNMFTGGGNFHSRLEWVSVSGMRKAAETLVHLTGEWAHKGKGQ
jgi:tripeptide aminopeptidase